jgi:hypothetical protein
VAELRGLEGLVAVGFQEGQGAELHHERRVWDTRFSGPDPWCFRALFTGFARHTPRILKGAYEELNS